jgi:hypothetical protein
VHRLDRPADRLPEAAAPGGDQLGISGIDFAEFVRGFIERAAAVEALVPGPQVGVFDELEPLRIVGDLPDEESVGSQP